MARKKVNRAWRAMEAFCPDWSSLPASDQQEEMRRLLCALAHLARTVPVPSFVDLFFDAHADFGKDENSARASGGESMKYDGYNRIHDDNKAEGRPIGKQWTDEDHYYRGGIKIYR